MKAKITRIKNAASMIINSSCGFYEKRQTPGIITVLSQLQNTDEAVTARTIASALENDYGIIPDEFSWNLLHVHPFNMGRHEVIVDCLSPGIIFTKGIADA